MSNKKITVQGRQVTIIPRGTTDYISLTDIARHKDSERTDYIIQNWLRNQNTIEYLGIWEQLNNPDFNPIEFDGIRKQAGLNSFSSRPLEIVQRAVGQVGITVQAQQARHVCSRYSNNTLTHARRHRTRRLRGWAQCQR